MALGRYLADKSAFEQQRHSDVAAGLLRALTADGALYMTEVVAMEMLYSARNADDYEARWDDLVALPWLRLTEAVAIRTMDIQRRLAGVGQHRRPIPDLLVAATALEHDATVLHYDRDFDLIAETTGLSARWIILAEQATPGRHDLRWTPSCRARRRRDGQGMSALHAGE